MHRALALAVALALAPFAAQAEAEQFIETGDAVFALSIGYPHAQGKDSLRYPGWDAARLVETLRGVYDPDGRRPNRFALLADFRTTADRDLFGHLPTRPPTRAALTRAVEDLNREMDAARGEGKRPVLLVFYAGHGEVGAGNMGHVFLRPAGSTPAPGVSERFTANDLRETVLERARAERVHLMVDACNAYFLLKSRGEEASSRRGRRQGRLGKRFSARLPHVGVVLSTSGVANVYESRVIQGGLFSHVLRSGLGGGADLDGNTAIDYGELETFFADAFSGIVNRDLYSPDVYVQPPVKDAAWRSSWATASVMKLPANAKHGYLVPKGDPRHLFVSDDRGLRLAQVHQDGSADTRLWLPPGRKTVHAVDRSGQHSVISTLEGSGWQTGTKSARPFLAMRGVAEAVVSQLFRNATGAARVTLQKDERKRAAREALRVEVARDRYLGLRISGGIAGRSATDVTDLPVSGQVTVGLRGESRRWIYGGAFQALLPAQMDAGPVSGGDFVSWGFNADGVLGYAVPLGPVLWEPGVTAGPSVRLQTGGGTAFGARATVGSTFIVHLPWDTDWALALNTKAGPEALWNVADEAGRQTNDLGWVWMFGVGVDGEWQR